MAAHSSILVWKIPLTKEPGGLLSMGVLQSWTRLNVDTGEGNGNPLRCSCLENPRDGGAWWAAVYGVAQSRTQLKRLSSSRMWTHGTDGYNLLSLEMTCDFPHYHIQKIKVISKGTNIICYHPHHILSSPSRQACSHLVHYNFTSCAPDCVLQHISKLHIRITSHSFLFHFI